MNGYELFCTYQAVKLHFTTDSYCYFKYNGRVGTKPESFEKRKDKYMFHRLARNLKSKDAVGFFVANFLINQKAWTQDFLQPEAMGVYNAWLKKYESLSYMFDQDMSKIADRIELRTMFKVPQDNSYPVIWQMMNQNEIQFETMVILHGLTGVLDLWDKHYSSDYIYEKTSKLIRKYEPFLGLDAPKFKSIVQKHLTPAEV